VESDAYALSVCRRDLSRAGARRCQTTGSRQSRSRERGDAQIKITMRTAPPLVHPHRKAIAFVSLGQEALRNAFDGQFRLSCAAHPAGGAPVPSVQNRDPTMRRQARRVIEMATR
jgi:hypothetical protein